MTCSSRLLLLAVLLSLAGFAQAAELRDAWSELTAVSSQPGYLKTHRFSQSDYRRRYMLYSPAGDKQTQTPKPLVLVIHGGAGTDRGMLKLTKRRWNALADLHNFYVVYPNAVNKLWDFGEGRTSGKLKKRVDDLAYFQRVIDDVASRKQIDDRRIFATGISRGGQASYFLACNLTERIRAIAPVAMGLPEFMKNECRQGPPVGIAVTNGTADPQVPFEGGRVTVFRQQRDLVMSAEDTLRLWRNRNGCRTQPDATNFIDKPGDSTSVAVKDWTECTGASVMFYQINNGGHTWPSGLQYLSPRIVGETSQDIDAADEAWKFFSRF